MKQRQAYCISPSGISHIVGTDKQFLVSKVCSGPSRIKDQGPTLGTPGCCLKAVTKPRRVGLKASRSATELSYRFEVAFFFFLSDLVSIWLRSAFDLFRILTKFILIVSACFLMSLRDLSLVPPTSPLC